MIGSFGRILLRGVREVKLNKWVQLLTLAGVTLVTFLVTGVLLLGHNLDIFVQQHQGQVQFQVYWENQASLREVQSDWEKIDSWPNLRVIRKFTPQAAIESLGKVLGPEGTGQTWQGVKLPATAVLGFSLPSQAGQEKAKAVLKRLRGLPRVQRVHYNPMQLKTAGTWVQISQGLAWPLIGLLALALALVVGNTFRLTLMRRHQEIEILELIGASRWYIQLPLLISGVAQGILGAGLALGLLKLTQASLNSMLNTPPLWLQVHYLPKSMVGWTVLGLGLLGALSSWVAVRRG